jgi:hypothetical protein
MIDHSTSSGQQRAAFMDAAIVPCRPDRSIRRDDHVKQRPGACMHARTRGSIHMTAQASSTPYTHREAHAYVCLPTALSILGGSTHERKEYRSATPSRVTRSQRHHTDVLNVLTCKLFGVQTSTHSAEMCIWHMNTSAPDF